MNIRLNSLFEKHNLSLKDRRDFLQIYDFLPSYKKIRVVENFDTMIGNIDELRDDLYLEQEVLLGHTLKNIEEYLETTQKKVVTKQANEAVARLKGML